MKAVILRDLRLAFAAGGGFGQGMGFFLVTILMLPLAIGSDRTLLAETAPAIIWISALLAGLLSLDRLFQSDQDDGSLTLLALSPTPLSSLSIAKSIAHWLVSGLPITLVSPIAAFMLGLNGVAIAKLFAALFIGTPALSFLGAIGAALTLTVNKPGLLIALITLPFYIPTLIFGTSVITSETTLSAFAMLFSITSCSFIIAPLAVTQILKRQLQ